MYRKLVSIVIPIYGVEKYIEQCAQSLFDQTYEHIQYIFVNDCTKDDSVRLLKKVIEAYPNRANQIEIIDKKTNEGQSLARKAGMQRVYGEYVMLVDSDDWLERTMVESLVEAIDIQKADVVYSDYYKNGNIQTPIDCRDISAPHGYIKNMFMLMAPAQTWNKIYRTELFQKVKFPKDSMHEDLYINLQVLYYATSIYHLSERLYHYRNNPNSISHKYPLEQSINNLRLMRQFLEDKEMYDVLPSFYSFLNYVKSFVFKRIHPLDKNLLYNLYQIDENSDKYILQRKQFNKLPTQFYLLLKSFQYKIGLL